MLPSAGESTKDFLGLTSTGDKEDCMVMMM